MSQTQSPNAQTVGAAGSGAGYVSTEADLWSALVTAADSEFVFTTTDINAGYFSADFGLPDGVGGETNYSLSYNAVTDPGINTGHVVRFRVKWVNIITADSFTELFVTFTFGGVGHNFKIASPTPGQGILPGSFFLVEYTMTSGEVDHYRANGGYTGSGNSVPQIGLVFYSDLFPPDHGSQEVYFDFIEVEIPNASDEVDITGSGGFELAGDASINTPNVTGSGGFELSGAGVVIASVDISGIYEIQDNKRNDTLYVRDGSEDTVDVEIPRPHYRTAFFGD